MTLHMITANRLSDGSVVYLDASGDWTSDVNNGNAVSEDETQRLMEAAAQAVAQCVVVAPYEIAIEKDGEVFRPVRLRERIRAQGPTVPAGRVV